MEGYRTVQELNFSELEQLRWDYFYGDDTRGKASKYDSPYQIPDEVIFKHFEGISFVKEDFSCNV